MLRSSTLRLLRELAIHDNLYDNNLAIMHADAVLKDFMDLESESLKIMFDPIILWIVPMMQS